MGQLTSTKDFMGQLTSTTSSKNVDCSLIRICIRLSQNKDGENEYILNEVHEYYDQTNNNELACELHMCL